MSRHLLVDRPDVQVFLGYDHMLLSFFGQRYNPAIARLEGIAIAGWPTGTGLGTRRPVRSHDEAAQDLDKLKTWARGQQTAAVWADPDAAAHLDTLIRTLRREWDDGADAPDVPLPAILQGAR